MSAQASGPVLLRSVLGQARGLWAELRNNRRAAAGVLVIAALLGLYGALRLDRAATRLHGEYHQDMQRMQRILAVRREGDWGKRQRAAAALQAELENRLWAADSEGVALANVQDWAAATGRDAGLDKPQIKIEIAQSKGLPANYRQLNVGISAHATDQALVDFLGRIEKDPHLMVVQQLHVHQQQGSSLQMSLVTYARVGGRDAVPPK
ncbi:MAG: hypothetical protein P4L83_04440 [Nevskia sp.]|nr:hypothetical protein [Nevskia sp.]